MSINCVEAKYKLIWKLLQELWFKYIKSCEIKDDYLGGTIIFWNNVVKYTWDLWIHGHMVFDSTHSISFICGFYNCRLVIHLACLTTLTAELVAILHSLTGTTILVATFEEISLHLCSARFFFLSLIFTCLISFLTLHLMSHQAPSWMAKNAWSAAWHEI